MNNITGDMKERKEKMTRRTDAIKIGCMDEDDQVGPLVLKIGLPGSGVVREIGGNEDLYPLNMRLIIKETGPYIREWVADFAKIIGVPAYVTSHPECGAGGAQGFKEKDLIDATKNIFNDCGINYAGHLKTTDTPEKTDNADIQSWFTRKQGENHSASHINITVGGGISGREKAVLERKNGRKAFDISADWVSHSLDKGFEKEKAVSALVFQFRLAYAIAERVRKNPDPFEIFNAQRLGDGVALTNSEIAREAVAIAQREISQKNWKAASHH